MKIIISDKQYKFLIESHKEFKEIDIIPSMSQDVYTTTQPNIEDIDPEIEYGLKHHFDDMERENLAHQILQKTSGKKSYKILWENKLNLNDLNDVAYVDLRYPVDLEIRLFDDNYHLHAKVKLKKFKDGYMVQFTEVYPIASGSRLGMKIYVKLVEVLNKPLYSDYIQTEEARRAIWEKIYMMYPDKLFAYYRNKLYKVYLFNKIMTFGDGKPVYSSKSNYSPLLVLMP